jgi:hydroxymethylbilane synthase
LLRDLRPDLCAADIRGNVDTRIRKLEAGEFDGIILASAGLLRLELQDRISELFPPSEFVPDAGQGILAVQTRVQSPASELAAAIDDPGVRLSATAERAVVRGLGAGCNSPVGAYAVLTDGRVRLTAMAADPEERCVYRMEDSADAEHAAKLGEAVGRELLRLLKSGATPTYTES